MMRPTNGAHCFGDILIKLSLFMAFRSVLRFDKCSLAEIMINSADTHGFQINNIRFDLPCRAVPSDIGSVFAFTHRSSHFTVSTSKWCDLKRNFGSRPATDILLFLRVIIRCVDCRHRYRWLGARVFSCLSDDWRTCRCVILHTHLHDSRSRRRYSLVITLCL